MDHAAAFLIALGVTQAFASFIVAALWRPLGGVLVDLCGTEARARFWRSYTAIMLLLVPLAAVLLGRSEGRGDTPVWLAVIDQAQWAVVGLIFALTVIALGLASFIQNRTATVAVRQDQVDDLHRLLSRVEELRARQVLRRTDEPEARHA